MMRLCVYYILKNGFKDFLNEKKSRQCYPKIDGIASVRRLLKLLYLLLTIEVLEIFQHRKVID